MLLGKPPGRCGGPSLQKFCEPGGLWAYDVSMLRLTPNVPIGESFRILCLGAHSDDIEIGCGGTVLRLGREYANLELYWVVFTADGEREQEAVRSAHLFLSAVQQKTVVVNQFKNGFFPYQGEEIKEYFERLKSAFSPDLIFTHYRHDLHQDHRLISELTWNTYRDHWILEYEIPKYDGDLGSPNLFVSLDETICRQKVPYILKSFKSQQDKHWFEEDTFWALLRIRGVEAGAEGKYAEGFHCRKAVL